MRGLKIHQAKMGCLSPSSVQRTGQPGETVEKPGPVSNHSIQNLQVPAKGSEGSTSTDVPLGATQGRSADIRQHPWHSDEIEKQVKSIGQQHTPGRSGRNFNLEVNEVLENVLVGELNRIMKAMSSHGRRGWRSPMRGSSGSTRLSSTNTNRWDGERRTSQWK